MRVYFYHTQDIQRILREHAEGRFPGHLLYGATHFAEHGIDVEWHQSIPTTSRLRQMLHSLWGVLRSYRRIDAVYATDLDEHRTGEIESADNRFTVTLRRAQIATFEIVMK